MKILKEHNFRACDKFGCGHFGASRSHAGDHEGVDLIAEKGEYVYAPFAGTITKYGFAYSGDLRWRYVELTGDEYVCRIFYMDLDPAHYVGKEVGKDWFLGVVSGIEEKYPGITPHVHFELRTLRGALLDPTVELKKKQ